jgi:hypothetical protein
MRSRGTRYMGLRSACLVADTILNGIPMDLDDIN